MWEFLRWVFLGKSKTGGPPIPDPRQRMKKKPISFDVTYHDQGSVNAYVELLCDLYQIKGNFTLKEIETVWREKRSDHPGHVLFATLDDYGQASYTSGHCTDTHELDDETGHDLSGLGPACFEDGEHVGYLTTKAEFPIRLANFLKKAREQDPKEIKGALSWNAERDESESLIAGDNVNALFREDKAYLQIVPVQHSYEAIAAFPNGYFQGDFSPFQNYVLAKQLHDAFGLDLFGIGATYLGFARDEPFKDDELAHLVTALSALYQIGPDSDDTDVVAQITDRLEGQRSFYLAYGER